MTILKAWFWTVVGLTLEFTAFIAALAAIFGAFAGALAFIEWIKEKHNARKLRSQYV